MKISGFTFIRNGVQFDYPFEESILSVLPLVDEMIVNVGVGEDSTLARVQALAAKNPKIKIFESVWDENLRKEGLILSQQTNLAMEKCTGDWGIYIQADEVIHEEDYLKIQNAFTRAHARDDVDGLLFDYVHFYADFFIVSKNPSAYRREIRAVRLQRGVQSWKDAQGFRKKNEAGQYEKLRVIHSGARIFHYGWVRPPEVMKEKTREMDTFYHTQGPGTGDNYKYKRVYGLERFHGTHPALMAPRIEAKRWKIDLLASPLVFTVKDIRKVISRTIERLTGWLPFEYKNYVRID